VRTSNTPFHENQTTGLKSDHGDNKNKQEGVSAYTNDRLAEKYKAINKVFLDGVT
jgi:hypothetical protein